VLMDRIVADFGCHYEAPGTQQSISCSPIWTASLRWQ
jgi:hypothetical protein